MSRIANLSTHEELEDEPMPGLPQVLPPGEQLLWQGKPAWRALARDAFHVPGLAIYFSIFIVARGVVSFESGKSAVDALLASAIVVPAALVCLGLLTALAWLNARATVYSITSRRVVLRFGVALPMTFNFPFKCMAAADMKANKGGDGEIALELSGSDRIAYLHLWPFARAWHVTRAQPTLRAIPDVAHVAGVLATAIQSFNGHERSIAELSTGERARSGSAAGDPSRVTLQRNDNVPQVRRSEVA